MSIYVLVPGAWHGGWAFRAVGQHLRAAGHDTLALTMPGLGVNDDPTGVTLSDSIAHTIDEIERRDLRDVHLVGHSWGGLVISGVAARAADRLAELVYYSAFVPSNGESLLDLCPPPYVELFEAVAGQSPTNSVQLPFEVWQGGFMQDAPESTQRVIWEALSSHPMGAFSERLRLPDYASLDLPLRYVLARDDIGLPPGEYGWDRFADRLGVRPTLVDGSHESLFTQPESVARGILHGTL